jgi:hypothetical protein
MDCYYAHQGPSTSHISYNLPAFGDSTVEITTFERNAIPLGFPPLLNTKQAWNASEFLNEDRYIHHLSNDEKNELDAALAFFKGVFIIK